MYPPFHVEGQAALKEFIAHHTRPPGLWHKHLVIEPLIDVDGDEASARSYFVVLVEHEGMPTVRVFGRPEELAERLEASGYDIPASEIGAGRAFLRSRSRSNALIWVARFL